jgi:hypothetical protein
MFRRAGRASQGPLSRRPPAHPLRAVLLLFKAGLLAKVPVGQRPRDGGFRRRRPCVVVEVMPSDPHSEQGHRRVQRKLRRSAHPHLSVLAKALVWANDSACRFLRAILLRSIRRSCRHQSLLAHGNQTQKAPPGGPGGALGGRRLTRRSSCGYGTRSGCSRRHPDHRTGWRRSVR